MFYGKTIYGRTFKIYHVLTLRANYYSTNYTCWLDPAEFVFYWKIFNNFHSIRVFLPPPVVSVGLDSLVVLLQALVRQTGSSQEDNQEE